MEIPKHILEKLRDCESEALAILESANNLITDFDTSSLRITISSSTPTPMLYWEELSQSMVFIIRYEHLPTLSNFVAGRHSNGNYYLNQTDDIRKALNEYRAIFFNKNDGISYGSITNLYHKAISNNDLHPRMKIETFDHENNNVSSNYLKHLKSRKKAIQNAINHSDFDFIFNGVLQHSDKKHASRMIKSYTDGSLTYLLLKNLIIAQGLKEFLREHYKLINTLHYPKIGPL